MSLFVFRSCLIFIIPDFQALLFVFIFLNLFGESRSNLVMKHPSETKKFLGHDSKQHSCASVAIFKSWGETPTILDDPHMCPESSPASLKPFKFGLASCYYSLSYMTYVYSRVYT